MLRLCCWSRISLALAPFPLCTPSRSIFGSPAPSGLSCGVDFHIPVSQNPPRPTAPPTRPPLVLPLVSTLQLLFWISQIAPVTSSLPSTSPPTELHAPLPRTLHPEHVRPGARTHVTDRCVLRCPCRRGSAGAFQAQGGATALPCPGCCSKPVREHRGFTPLPWNSLSPRLRDKICLLCARAEF